MIMDTFKIWVKISFIIFVYLKVLFIDAFIATLIVVSASPILGVMYLILTLYMFVLYAKAYVTMSKFLEKHRDAITDIFEELKRMKGNGEI